MGGRRLGAVLAGVLLACGSSGGGATKGSQQQCGAATCQNPIPGCTLSCPTPPKPPVTLDGGWTFWSKDQGIDPNVWDVSADEGGNAYVAAEDALFVKAKGATDFTRVDPAAAGLTASCHPASEIDVASPTDAATVCPIISVAGAQAGKAFVGFKGVGIDDDADALWALRSGGADEIAFDGTKVTRVRHVLIASPPHHMCEHWLDAQHTQCDPNDWTWVNGRMKLRQVQRIVVNHDASRPMSYGDALFAGTHASISVLAAHPAQRGMLDFTNGDPAWVDSQWTWEHEHPALDWPDGRFLTGETWALALDPKTNVPWFANQFRMASMPGYAQMNAPTWNDWWGGMVPDYPYIAIWQPTSSPDDASLRDNVSSISFCDDGTAWIASETNGLAHMGTDGSFSLVSLPPNLGNSALAVACDPSDSSVWVGFGWGGFGRLKDGAWTLTPPGAPTFAAKNPVRSIQIDRWSSPRVVYVASQPSQRYGPGGVTAYDGP